MKNRFLFALIACLCLLLSACSTTPTEETTSPTGNETPVATDTTPAESSDEAVFFYVAEEPVTYIDFNFHYSETVDSFFQSGAYEEAGVDPDKSLSDQQYPGLEMSWEDMFFQQQYLLIQRF